MTALFIGLNGWEGWLIGQIAVKMLAIMDLSCKISDSTSGTSSGLINTVHLAGSSISSQIQVSTLLGFSGYGSCSCESGPPISATTHRRRKGPDFAFSSRFHSAPFQRRPVTSATGSRSHSAPLPRLQSPKTGIRHA
jgi:hypothetical protein